MKNIFGILLCLAVAVLAWFLGRLVPLVGGPVIAIIVGITIACLVPNLAKVRIGREGGFSGGLKFTSKKVLQYSIVFLGFEMNLYNLLDAGRASLIVMGLTFTLVFVAAYVAGRLLKLSGNTTTLIGVGTAICGGSAIAAVAPVIRAEDEEVTKAISTIFLFNVIAVFLFPGLGRLMGMDDPAFGIWAGTAITDTSSVVAAGTAWSVETGNNVALNYATIVKLTRTLLIVPIALVLALRSARRAKTFGTGNFSFTKVFPWFILLFVAAVLCRTFLPLPASLTSVPVTLGKFGIVMAMSAIGLNTNLKALFSNGIRPVLLGGICWLVITLVTLPAMRFQF